MIGDGSYAEKTPSTPPLDMPDVFEYDCSPPPILEKSKAKEVSPVASRKGNSASKSPVSPAKRRPVLSCQTVCKDKVTNSGAFDTNNTKRSRKRSKAWENVPCVDASANSSGTGGNARPGTTGGGTSKDPCARGGFGRRRSCELGGPDFSDAGGLRAKKNQEGSGRRSVESSTAGAAVRGRRSLESTPVGRRQSSELDSLGKKSSTEGIRKSQEQASANFVGKRSKGSVNVMAKKEQASSSAGPAKRKRKKDKVGVEVLKNEAMASDPEDGLKESTLIVGGPEKNSHLNQENPLADETDATCHQSVQLDSGGELHMSITQSESEQGEKRVTDTTMVLHMDDDDVNPGASVEGSAGSRLSHVEIEVDVDKDSVVSFHTKLHGVSREGSGSVDCVAVVGTVGEHCSDSTTVVASSDCTYTLGSAGGAPHDESMDSASVAASATYTVSLEEGPSAGPNYVGGSEAKSKLSVYSELHSDKVADAPGPVTYTVTSESCPVASYEPGWEVKPTADKDSSGAVTYTLSSEHDVVPDPEPRRVISLLPATEVEANEPQTGIPETGRELKNSCSLNSATVATYTLSSESGFVSDRGPSCADMTGARDSIDGPKTDDPDADKFCSDVAADAIIDGPERAAASQNSTKVPVACNADTCDGGFGSVLPVIASNSVAGDCVESTGDKPIIVRSGISRLVWNQEKSDENECGPDGESYQAGLGEVSPVVGDSNSYLLGRDGDPEDEAEDCLELGLGIEDTCDSDRDGGLEDDELPLIEPEDAGGKSFLSSVPVGKTFQLEAEGGGGPKEDLVNLDSVKEEGKEQEWSTGVVEGNALDLFKEQVCQEGRHQVVVVGCDRAVKNPKFGMGVEKNVLDLFKEQVCQEGQHQAIVVDSDGAGELDRDSLVDEFSQQFCQEGDHQALVVEDRGATLDQGSEGSGMERGPFAGVINLGFDDTDSFSDDCLGLAGLNRVDTRLKNCIQKWRRKVFQSKWPIAEGCSADEPSCSGLCKAGASSSVRRGTGNYSRNMAGNSESSDGTYSMGAGRVLRQRVNLDSSDVDTGRANKVNYSSAPRTGFVVDTSSVGDDSRSVSKKLEQGKLGVCGEDPYMAVEEGEEATDVTDQDITSAPSSTADDKIVCTITSDQPLDRRVSISYNLPQETEGLDSGPELQLRVRLAGNPSLESCMVPPPKVSPQFEARGCMTEVSTGEGAAGSWLGTERSAAVATLDRTSHLDEVLLAQPFESMLGIMDIVFWFFITIVIVLYEVV